MEVIDITRKVHIPISELQFRFTRSSGPGGQNVNRVSTRVELLFDMANSSLDQEAKALLREKLRTRLTANSLLRIVSQESRSQWKNKQSAIERFRSILKNALRITKKRLPTSASRASKEARLSSKKGRGRVKRLRKFDLEKELT